ncbi:hypothetical protein SLEP1_g17738 [Rubroshorea leprosula]|uniref:Uncharacterized protein n=1 Tax=Rubroshorea leprosula TaxID=152421 RepID=A0AAV5J5S4_9ROSI|nr:hypothetical protein SLEP1_g17738 [Rubroshorea leprosula]
MIVVPESGLLIKGAACLNDNEMAYDKSSRVEPLRSHQWFMDSPETELFPNKKQAVNAVSTSKLFSGMLNSNVSLWGNTSGFHLISGHFSERLFDPETARTMNFDDQGIPSVSLEKVDMGRKANEDMLGNDSSFGLSMCQTLEDPRSGLSYGGIRKVKVSQVEDSSISMGLGYNKGNENILSIGDTYDKDINVFISMGQSYNRGKRALQANENAISMCHALSKVNDSTISMGHTHDKSENHTLSIGQSFTKGEGPIISFGGYDDDDDTNPSGSLIFNYDLLVSQTSIQRSEALDEKDVKLNAEALVSSGVVSASGAEVSSKKDDPKTSKKVQSNNYPSNVRSLLSTGMLDGVPVKYTAWL